MRRSDVVRSGLDAGGEPQGCQFTALKGHIFRQSVGSRAATRCWMCYELKPRGGASRLEICTCGYHLVPPTRLSPFGWSVFHLMQRNALPELDPLRPNDTAFDYTIEYASAHIRSTVFDLDHGIELLVTKCAGVDSGYIFRRRGIDFHEVDFAI